MTKIKKISKIGFAAEVNLDTPHGPHGAAADPYTHAPGRREHLAKVAEAVRVKEHDADDPTRSTPRANAKGPKAPPHTEVGSGR